MSDLRQALPRGRHQGRPTGSGNGGLRSLPGSLPGAFERRGRVSALPQRRRRITPGGSAPRVRQVRDQDGPHRQSAHPAAADRYRRRDQPSPGPGPDHRPGQDRRGRGGHRGDRGDPVVFRGAGQAGPGRLHRSRGQPCAEAEKGGGLRHRHRVRLAQHVRGRGDPAQGPPWPHRGPDHDSVGQQGVGRPGGQGRGQDGDRRGPGSPDQQPGDRADLLRLRLLRGQALLPPPAPGGGRLHHAGPGHHRPDGLPPRGAGGQAQRHHPPAAR